MEKHSVQVFIRGSVECVCPSCGRRVKISNKGIEILYIGDNVTALHEGCLPPGVIFSNPDGAVQIEAEEMFEIFRKKK